MDLIKKLWSLIRRKKKEKPFSFKEDILKRYGKKEENKETKTAECCCTKDAESKSKEE
jgi:acyl-ACP thioesterase